MHVEPENQERRDNRSPISDSSAGAMPADSVVSWYGWSARMRGAEPTPTGAAAPGAIIGIR